jgi:hypothetical protein
MKLLRYFVNIVRPFEADTLDPIRLGRLHTELLCDIHVRPCLSLG